MAEFDLGTYGAEIVIDQSQFNQTMKKAEKKMDGFGSKMKSFGKSIGGLAAGAIAGLGAALVGVGIAGINMAGDLQNALNDLQTQTGATDKEIKGMEKSLKNIYNANLGESFKDIANAMALVRQNTGLAGDALEEATKQALLLRKTFGYEVSESTRAASQLMKEFGVTSSKAMNLLAEATQEGLNKSDDLIDTVEEYSIYFNKAGIDAKGMFAIFKNASKAGVRNLDFVGDAMKEFGIIMKASGDKAENALKALGLPAQKLTHQFAQGGEGAKKAFQTIITELGKVKNPLKQSRIGVELFGTKFEDLEADAILAMGNVNSSIKGSETTLKSINKVKFNSFGAALQGIKRNLQTALITPLKKYILPLLSQFSQFIIDHMPQIKAFISTTFRIIGKIITTTVRIIRGLINAFTKTSKSTNTNFTEIRKTIKKILTTVQAIISTFTKFVTIMWKKYGDDLLRYAKATFENILQIISGLLTVIRGVVKTITSLITGDWKGALDGLKMIFQGTWNAILGILNQALDMMKVMFTIELDIISNVVSSVFHGITSTIRNAVYGAYSYVRDKFSSMRRRVSGIFGSIYSTARRIFGNIGDAIISPVSRAVDVVRSLVSRIQDAFDFNWSLPDLDLPHVSVDVDWASVGGISLPYPDFNVSWYKDGGYFDKPSVIGIGEAGPEMALPLIGKRMEPFAEAVSRKMAEWKRNNGTTNNNDHSTVNLYSNFNFEVHGELDKKKADEFYQHFAKKMTNGLRTKGVGFA